MDDFFGPPFIDVDEWRDRPFRHRYVHGGFEGTDTRFAFYFPEPSAYEGRFVQFLQGGRGGNEHQGALLGGLLIPAENGAYYLESNQGHIGNDMTGLKGDPTIMSWRASAQSARYAREVATEMYGEAPHHGYVFGGSGGAMRSVDCIESAPDIWDGAVPFMINRVDLINYNWSIAAWVGSILGDKVSDVVDAVDPGGSGNPFAVLASDEQRQALAALYRAGYCRGAESQIVPNPLWILGMEVVRVADRKYFSDFWSELGYEGAENSSSVGSLLIEEKGVVQQIQLAKEMASDGVGGLEDINAMVLGRIPGDTAMGIVVDVPGDPGRFLGSILTITSGKAAGRQLLCSGAVNGALVAILDPVGFRDVAPGDTIQIDNRDFVAYLFYHRHLVDERYPVMRQFIIDRVPIYPQRPINFDDIPVPTGRFQGKMILLQHAHDRECWPNCAEPYIQDVRRHLGDKTDQRFRIWWIENAAHLVPLTSSGRTRLINYQGCYAQAVRDVIAWVEDGVEPPPSTTYTLKESGHLKFPSTVAERKGIQPVLTATANDSLRAEVKVGEEVRFKGVAEVTPGTGTIVIAEWDFDGSGSWPVNDRTVDGSQSVITATVTHTYDKPGTYFATFRAGAHREGDVKNPLRLVTNLARARVVVSA